MGSKSNTQTVSTDPWAPSQPYLLDTMRQAQQLYNNGASTVAPFNPYQTAAYNQMAQLAGYNGPSPSTTSSSIGGMLGNNLNAGWNAVSGQPANSNGNPAGVNPNVTAANGVIGQALSGGMIGQNPYATAANPYIGAADTSGVTQAITDAAQRAVGDEFSMAGRSGSPAQGITLGKTIANQLAPYEYGAQQDALNRSFTGAENQITVAITITRLVSSSSFRRRNSLLSLRTRQISLAYSALTSWRASASNTRTSSRRRCRTPITACLSTPPS